MRRRLPASSPAPSGPAISRRALLQGLGVAVAVSAVPHPWRPGADALPARRAYVYVDYAAGTHRVLGALLTGDPRVPRQILRRAKRHRLPAIQLPAPEVEARRASDPFKAELYRLLARQQGFRKGRGLGLEVYGLHLGPAAGAGARARNAVAPSPQGDAALLEGLVALLGAIRLVRFGEIFVYLNLPALRGVPRKTLRATLLGRVRRHPRARFAVYLHRPVRRHGGRPADEPLGAAPAGAAGPRVSVDEGIQVADFVTHAFFEHHERRNSRWLRAIRILVRRDIDGASLPAVQK